MERLRYRVIPSPLGPLTVAGVGSTVLHLRMTDQAHEPDRSGWEPAESDAYAEVVQQLDEYFAGTRRTFEVDVQLTGTEFQRRVWTALQTIPYGETRTYGQIAEQVGSPAAFRAVGLANGRNPVSIIVPCHRVIGSSGGLTGYGGGVEKKAALLGLERQHAPKSGNSENAD